MSTLICRAVHFGYPEAADPIFSDLNLTLSRQARTGLAGRNGRGKTTLLRLLSGALQPDRGQVEGTANVRLFAPPDAPGALTGWEAAKDSAGPFRRWEAAMDKALRSSGEQDLARYGELQQRYADAGGYSLEGRLGEALAELDVPQDRWHRPLANLSGGEVTRLLLAGLFASDQVFPLIDEPTNHLDRTGRELLARFLARQSGFLLVSHDRAFADLCTTQTLVLNRDDVELNRGSFSAWRARHQLQLAAQADRNQQLRREAQRLTDAAGARREGAHAREAKKSGAVDKGFEGARAARQMKRALAAEQRAERAAEGRRAAMHNIEKRYPLSFAAHTRGDATVIAHNLQVCRSEPLFAPVSFALAPGQRLAVSGANGIGKTSLLRLLAGDRLPRRGELKRSARIAASVVSQEPVWRAGLLTDHLASAGLNETRFRQILAALGMRGAQAEGPLELMSLGQRKKVEVARSLLEPSQLLLWDEPLNYLDIDAREALETAIIEAAPTMVLIEHDASFVAAVATAELVLQPAATTAPKHPG